jgi:outer membrane protein TolC
MAIAGMLAAALASSIGAASPFGTNEVVICRLKEVLNAALSQNRQLQIERINPELARFTLQASRGFYDPIFQTITQSESTSDTGGFDPADFSNDAIFDADSEVISAGFTGFLPSGLTYTVGGNYAHTQGTRNFLNFDSYKLGTSITVQQPLLRNLWIDQPRWTIQVNKKNLQITELGVQFVAMTVLNLAQQAYYDLVYAWDNYQIYRDLRDTRREFVRGIRRQIELGMMTSLEEKLAQSQEAAVQTDLVTARNTIALASNSLRSLMGTPRSDWKEELLAPADLMIVVPELIDKHSSWKTGLERRPDLLQLAVNLESAELTIRYRRNQLFPTLNLIGSYGLRGSDAIQAFPPDQPQADFSLAWREITAQSAPNSMVGLLFSMPLTLTAERANYKMSKELRKQAELLLRQKEEMVLREIADAADLARSSLDRFLAAQDAARFANEALKAEEQRLQGGTGSTFLVLQAQTEWARSLIAELAARRDYNKALSQLYFTEGTLLERSGIEVQFQ